LRSLVSDDESRMR